MNSLEHLIPGDRLAVPVTGSPWGGVPRVEHNLSTIEKVTNLQLLCSDGLRARRSDGRIIGGAHTSHTYAIHANQRIVTEHEEQKAAQFAHYALSARIRRMTEALDRNKVSRAALAELVEVYERHYPAA